MRCVSSAHVAAASVLQRTISTQNRPKSHQERQQKLACCLWGRHSSAFLVACARLARISGHELPRLFIAEFLEIGGEFPVDLASFLPRFLRRRAVLAPGSVSTALPHDARTVVWRTWLLPVANSYAWPSPKQDRHGSRPSAQDNHRLLLRNPMSAH